MAIIEKLVELQVVMTEMFFQEMGNLNNLRSICYSCSNKCVIETGWTCTGGSSS